MSSYSFNNALMFKIFGEHFRGGVIFMFPVQNIYKVLIWIVKFSIFKYGSLCIETEGFTC